MKTDFGTTTPFTLTGGQTLSGASSYSMVQQWGYLAIRTDGANWFIVAAG